MDPVVTHPVSRRVVSGQNGRVGWKGQRNRSNGVFETNPSGRERVEIRRLDTIVAVALDPVGTQRVQRDQDHVGAGSRAFRYGDGCPSGAAKAGTVNQISHSQEDERSREEPASVRRPTFRNRRVSGNLGFSTLISIFFPALCHAHQST